MYFSIRVQIQPFCRQAKKQTKEILKFLVLRSAIFMHKILKLQIYELFSLSKFKLYIYSFSIELSLVWLCKLWDVSDKNHTLWYKAQVAGSRHTTALIPIKFTRRAYNIQKHSLGINSLTLTGVMIPVNVSMLIFVHFYHPHSLELSLFCLLSSLLFVHATNQHDIYSSCFSSVCLCLFKWMVINTWE
jgi:hypothetical protein